MYAVSFGPALLEGGNVYPLCQISSGQRQLVEDLAWDEVTPLQDGKRSPASQSHKHFNECQHSGVCLVVA